VKHTFPLLMTLMTILTGCSRGGVPGSGVAKIETRDLPSFTAVEFNGGGKLEITIGHPQSIEITADDNLLPIISMRVTDGRLVIEPREPIRPKIVPAVKITVADLSALTMNGAARCVLTNLANDRMAIEINGAGDVRATGRIERLSVKMAGAGRVDAVGLYAERVDVDIDGSGDVDVYANESLDVSIAGAGDVRYAGNPQVSQSIAGVGSVIKTNAAPPATQPIDQDDKDDSAAHHQTED
jgi:hypothetical protein